MVGRCHEHLNEKLAVETQATRVSLIFIYPLGKAIVIIGDRLRALRERKNLSQIEIAKRTGFVPCYVSRVEHGHTVPSVETLEKFARALEVPIYKLFYDSDDAPKVHKIANASPAESSLWERTGKDAIWFQKFRRVLARLTESDRKLLMSMAQKMVK